MAAKHGVVAGPPADVGAQRLHSGVIARGPRKPDAQPSTAVPTSEAPTMPPPALSADDAERPSARRVARPVSAVYGAATETVVADLRRDPRAEK
jgi:hypothetical protein